VLNYVGALITSGIKVMDRVGIMLDLLADTTPEGFRHIIDKSWPDKKLRIQDLSDTQFDIVVGKVRLLILDMREAENGQKHFNSSYDVDDGIYMQ
jgi:hypothetical protein